MSRARPALISLALAALLCPSAAAPALAAPPAKTSEPAPLFPYPWEQRVLDNGPPKIEREHSLSRAEIDELLGR